MKQQEARTLRLRSLLLTGDSSASPLERASPLETVSWFGAMQAQDLNSGRWSVGVRGMPTTQAAVDDAIEAGEILRTWPMRGTIHLVAAQDAKWMLLSAGARALGGVAKRWEYLGLDRKTVDHATDVLAENLQGGKRLLRSEATQVMADAGIDTSAQRTYHMLWYASQIGVTCIGPSVGSEQTFVLLEEWAPESRELDEDAAYTEFARRYFRSHGPATVADFARWVGVSMGIAKSAVAALGDLLAEVDIDGQTYLATVAALDAAAAKRSGNRSGNRVLLLPGFDEFILGYKDRQLVLADEFKNRIVPGANGVFKPTIVDDGTVIGTWGRKQRAKETDILLDPFDTLSSKQLKAIDSRISELGDFLGQVLVRKE